MGESMLAAAHNSVLTQSIQLCFYACRLACKRSSLLPCRNRHGPFYLDGRLAAKRHARMNNARQLNRIAQPRVRARVTSLASPA